MGFSSYVRARMLSCDDRFRNNQTYVMFMLLVKEAIEMRRSRTTYCRKARKVYQKDVHFLKEAAKDDKSKKGKDKKTVVNDQETEMVIDQYY